MVELFCDSFAEVPRRILLDIDDTEDRVHGGQQLSLWNAHYDRWCIAAAAAHAVMMSTRPLSLTMAD
jgi:Transposase DDE domain group 1